ncbi:SixA phosphatase family protein [Botryobacter ruber]|uniref:SixA phosphatase family protein n=1 Tax=Botryobacter ruber TaxID=2171629 RepID=UPI000E0C879E|nr:phosphoglycerate mutase family protein [Botryobacter ruber]
MRIPFLQYLLLALLLCTTVFCREPQTETASAADTNTTAAPVTVYLVRHAEKDTSNPTEQDPELTAQGHARAEALKELLSGEQVGALYTTKYKRSQQTLKPLAEARNLQLQVYEANDFKSLKQRLLQQYQGQTVVIAGHSNTLLPLMEEFGARIKLSHIPETEYDYIFKLVMNPGQAATVEVNRYSSMPE